MKRVVFPLSIAVLIAVAFASGLFWHKCAGAQGNAPQLRGTTVPGVAAEKFHNQLPSFADMAEKLKPAVVNISTAQVIKARKSRGPAPDFFGGEDFFNRFFGMHPDREMKRTSLGSGFIWDKNGYIVTNSHVVEGASEITVTLAGEEEYKAKLIGRDSKTDLALIKIEPPAYLPTVPLGDSNKLRIGDWVMAIGNPFNIGQTVTAGIVSAKGRIIGAGPYDDFIQTDAAINPGNSGGPLFNLEGEVIGINTAIVAGGQGIGFAIPVNLAKHIISQLKESGQIKRGWLGVVIQKITPEMLGPLGVKEKSGALIAQIVKNGPADKAGLKRGDIIIAFDGRPIGTMNDLPILVADTPVGKEVPVKVLRKGKEETFRIKVGLMPEDGQEALAKADEKGQKDKLGMSVENITPEIAKQLDLEDVSGVVVSDVEPDGPAAQAGLTRGDAVREINYKEIKDAKDYLKVVATLPAKEKILLLVQRGERYLYVVVTPK